MNLLNFSRMALLIAIAGSIIFFATIYMIDRGLVDISDIIRYLPHNLATKDIIVCLSDRGCVNNIRETLEAYYKFWPLISGILTALASVGARSAFNLEKSLNRDRYWVCRMQQGDRVYGLMMGDLQIKNINNYKKRRENPGEVICGQIHKVFGSEIDKDNNVFRATDIVVGRKSTSTIYYEWDWHSGNASREDSSGLTKIKYHKNLRKGGLYLSGKVLIEGEVGFGVIEYFDDQNQAEACYQARSSQLSQN